MKDPTLGVTTHGRPMDPPDPPTLYLYDDGGVPVFAGNTITLFWQGDGSSNDSIYTFDDSGNSFDLFDGSTAPYTISSSGTLFTVRSGADPGVYRIRYTSSSSGAVRGTINVKRVTEDCPPHQRG